jgi:hypothetical protein
VGVPAAPRPAPNTPSIAVRADTMFAKSIPLTSAGMNEFLIALIKEDKNTDLSRPVST